MYALLRHHSKVKMAGPSGHENNQTSPSKSSSPVSATGMRLKGEPVQVVVASEDGHKFDLDQDALASILLSDSVRHKKVVVVSVAGAFRKGKSFLLDFFLRYLNARASENWLGDDTSPLEGFTWRGGADRETTGILLWSEPFPAKLPNGEEVVILLMDTQGAFDTQSTVKDCATVFALSTMISSVQVFNITSNIQEDDLQHLQLFTEYGRLALEENGGKPFQKLMFLVRDWSYPWEYAYGLDGGNILINKRLQPSDKQHPELQQLRLHIKKCFSDISCYLMPHPGLKVATNPSFDGRLADIEPDFKKELRTLVPLLLSNENLVKKEISGSNVTGQGLLEYFKAYVKIYQGDELPEPKSMLQATAEANNLAAVGDAKDHYTKAMDEVCGGDKPYMHPDLLQQEHEKVLQQALQVFHSKKKMGGTEFSNVFADKLGAELAEMYESLKKFNENKNVFKARTAAVLFVVMAVLYLLSGLLGIVGLEGPANLLNFLMGCTLVLLATWAYVKYSGEHREIGQKIDSFAEIIWEKALANIAEKIMQDQASRMVRSGDSKKSK